MALLGLLAAGAVKGGAQAKIDAEEKKNSLFREILGQEVSAYYDARRIEAQSAKDKNVAYYKNELATGRDIARSNQRLQEIESRGAQQLATQEAKHGQNLELQSVRDKAANARVNIRESGAQSRANMREANANARSAEALKIRQQQLNISQQLADTKGELAEVTKAKSGVAIDKSKQMKNNSGLTVDTSMFQ